MILCLDVGNTQIFGGVFEGEELRFTFRYATSPANTSDQMGIFLRIVMRENGIEPASINRIAICSVVPYLDYTLKAACKKYFNVEPFVLQAGVKTGLKIKYRNPLEVGADRIANAIAATYYYPQTNIINIDFGTATTFCAISKNTEYLGGVIIAGMRTAMNALQANTAKLSAVEILKPETVVGRSTAESLQAGLYYGQLGTVRELIQRMNKEVFANEKAVIIATGGFSHLFTDENIFTTIISDLVLQGLRLALIMNE